jgi:hypothetical protein
LKEYGGSLRGWERASGISRHLLAAEIEAGRLRASRIGARRIFVSREAFDQWLRSREIRPGAHAARVVNEVLGRT